MQKINVVCFSEIFRFAETKLGWSWNKCCNIFHQGGILVSPESDNKKFYLGDDEGDYNKEIEKNPDNEEVKARLLIYDFMRENNVKEILVTND